MSQDFNERRSDFRAVQRDDDMPEGMSAQPGVGDLEEQFQSVTAGFGSMDKRMPDQMVTDEPSNAVDEIEQSFGIESGRYRRDDGTFAVGSPPTDYDQGTERYRANDGRFKNRSKDLGMGTPHDAPADDAATSFGMNESGLDDLDELEGF